MPTVLLYNSLTTQVVTLPKYFNTQQLSDLNGTEIFCSIFLGVCVMCMSCFECYGMPESPIGEINMYLSCGSLTDNHVSRTKLNLKTHVKA